MSAMPRDQHSVVVVVRCAIFQQLLKFFDYAQVRTVRERRLLNFVSRASTSIHHHELRSI